MEFSGGWQGYNKTEVHMEADYGTMSKAIEEKDVADKKDGSIETVRETDP